MVIFLLKTYRKQQESSTKQTHPPHPPKLYECPTLSGFVCLVACCCCFFVNLLVIMIPMKKQIELANLLFEDRPIAKQNPPKGLVWDLLAVNGFIFVYCLR